MEARFTMSKKRIAFTFGEIMGDVYLKHLTNRMEKQQEDKCLRCGKCCVVYNMETKKWDDCKHLFKSWITRYKNFNHLFTECCCYDDRIGKWLGYGFRYGYRKDLHYNIPDCPYNQEGWVIHPAYRENDTESAKELKRLHCVQSNHQE